MAKKPSTTRTRRRRRSPAAKAIPSVSISFGAQELQFLMQTLRDLPIKGTPDTLAQALPLIQTVRLKFATAFQTVAGAAPSPEAAPPPPEDAPAAE